MTPTQSPRGTHRRPRLPCVVISIDITDNLEVYHDINDDEWPFSLRIGDAYETMSREELVKLCDAIASLLETERA